jgi:aminoglycoside 6'-N-acetyltransferase I
MNVRLQEAQDQYFPDWLRMRESLYTGLTQEFHETEITIYHNASDKICMLAFLEDEAKPVGFIEISLRNVVDGCLSSPVAYLEGIFVEPAKRGVGIARTMLSYAKDWAQARSHIRKE